jgi:multidrug resistance efflux pump
MSRRPTREGGSKAEDSFAKLRAEIDRLRRDLAQAQARIAQLEQGGADPLIAKRLAELEEGQKVARGLATDATLARSRAEAELKTLRGAIEKAPGVHGWLLRRALRRLGGPAARSRGTRNGLA